MNKIINKIKQIIKSIKDSYQRFPEVFLVSLSIAILGIMLNHDMLSNIEDIERLFFPLILLVPLATYGRLIYERKNDLKLRIIIDGGVLVFALIFYWFLPENLNQGFAIKYFGLLIVSILALTVIHYRNQNNYSIYLLDLIGEFFVTLLFSLVLLLGIFSIIFTIEQLFELSIDSEIYFDIFIIIASMFSVTYFLSKLPETGHVYDTFMFPVILRKLIQMIIVPLIIVYTIILYLYFGRVILLRIFPINLLSHLVMWYGLVSIVILFFINKVKDEHKLLSVFYKLFPIAIILPVIMLFVAISRRVMAYSITPERYYVILIGIWILGSALYIRFSKNFKPNYIVISAMVLILLSIYGPQSAFNLSLTAQENRLINVLEQSDMIIDNKVVKNSNLTTDEQAEIADFIRYFDRYHQYSDIDILPDDFSRGDMKEVFGFGYYISRPFNDEFIRYNYFKEERIINISDYRYYINLNITIDSNSEIVDDELTLKYDENSYELTIIETNGNELGVLNLTELIDNFHKRHEGSNLESLESASIDLKNGLKGKLIIRNIYYNASEKEGSMSFDLFIE